MPAIKEWLQFLHHKRWYRIVNAYADTSDPTIFWKSMTYLSSYDGITRRRQVSTRVPGDQGHDEAASFLSDAYRFRVELMRVTPTQYNRRKILK